MVKAIARRAEEFQVLGFRGAIYPRIQGIRYSPREYNTHREIFWEGERVIFTGIPNSLWHWFVHIGLFPFDFMFLGSSRSVFSLKPEKQKLEYLIRNVTSTWNKWQAKHGNNDIHTFLVFCLPAGVSLQLLSYQRNIKSNCTGFVKKKTGFGIHGAK